MMTKEIMKRKDAAEYLGIGQSTLDDKVKKGKIPYTKHILYGKVFKKIDLDELKKV